MPYGFRSVLGGGRALLARAFRWWDRSTRPREAPRLLPARRNPVLSPLEASPWESKAVFNPAAILVDDTVHLLYRAIGDQDRSALGHAVSRCGVHFERTGRRPAYTARTWFEGTPHVPLARPAADPGSERLGAASLRGGFASGGGGWGGTEDPRLTRIDDRIHMTYVAYNGFDPPRVALSSIAVDDFVRRRWNWSPPVLISRPHEVNKNAVLFPRRIRGRYVMIHRVYPNILLDYLDDLDFDGTSRWLEGHHVIPPSLDGWDNHKVGAGPPPIETPHGWLLITQGVGRNDGYRYKIGAMLLDRDHPETVLARPKHAILAPHEWAANEGWKAGVVYPCGAVVKDGRLFIYYGGADTYVCAATAPVAAFVEALIRDRRPPLRRLRIPRPADLWPWARRIAVEPHGRRRARREAGHAPR
jgi:predicted GH43/DUF377 family glycosyl hydrolase